MKSPLLFVLTLPVLASDLPKGANRVDSCPKPYDKEAWKNASIELGCSEHISSSNDIRTKTYYHCLASAYINETIEFCAKVAAIERGKCPIYNYAKGATVATSRSCANYTKGCPNPRESPYYSWSFFKYPECWSINKVSRCFHEEPNCPPEEKGFDPSLTTGITVSTTDTEINDTLPTDETTTTSTTSTDQRWIFIVTGLTSLVILTCLVYFFFKMNRRRRQRKTKEKPEEETNMKLLDHKDDKIEEKNVGEVYFASPPKTAQPHQEMPVISSPLETSLESQSRTKGQDVGPNSSIDRLCDDLPSVLYSDLLYTLTEAMTKDLCHRIIHVLKDQKKDLNILNRIHEAKELIDYMDGNYLKRNDVIYVQIISWKFKALPLYELCLDYAKRIPKDVSFVEIKTEKDKTKCIIYCPQQSLDKKQKTKIKEMLACYLRFDDCVFKDSHDDNSEVQPFVNKAVYFPKESDRNKEKTRLEFHMENQSESAKEALQKWIEELNEPHPEKINYEVLPESPNVVTTRSSCEHAEAFLKYVKTDEGQTAAFTKKVKRIIHINEVITIEDALNGSNFVHVSLRMNKNQTRASKEDLKEAASMVVKESGVKMVGNTVYVRESTGNTSESGGIIFIEKNWNSLLNNLELSTLLSVEEVVSCFDEDDIARIKSFENRRSKVDHLLKMCIKLPTEKLEKVLPHLEKCVPSCTASPSSSELDSARNWIHQKRDILLEELELDFIEKSLSRMHDVPSDVTNGDLRRKEKIQNFIEFVLQNDDAVMLIQKEMAEFVQDM